MPLEGDSRFVNYNIEIVNLYNNFFCKNELYAYIYIYESEKASIYIYMKKVRNTLGVVNQSRIARNVISSPG